MRLFIESIVHGASSTMRILLVGDQSSHLEAVINYLQRRNFDVEVESQISIALRRLQEGIDNLLLLQAGPQSLAVLKQVRRVSQIPVMAIADQINVKQRVELYKNGVDDYVSSWVEKDELQFRVNALLRRNTWGDISRSESTLNEDVLEIDNLLLNRKTQKAKLADTEIQLTPVQFRLLWTMASHKDRVLSKPFLYRVLFNREYTIDDRGVDIHVSRVRKKLDLAGGAAARLSTVHGQGYCFR